MIYTEYSLAERIATQRNIVRLFEGKAIEAIEQREVARTIANYYALGSRPGGKNGAKAEAAKQQIDAKTQEILELSIALPVLRARLDVLIESQPKEPEEPETDEPSNIHYMHAGPKSTDDYMPVAGLMENLGQ